MVDVYTKRLLLWSSAVVGLAFLGGCSFLTKVDQFISPERYLQVYENQYVIDADGYWCPWSPNVRACNKVYPPGLYLINDNLEVVTKQGESRLVIANQENTRGCERLFRDSSQGSSSKVACSPNFFYRLAETNDTNYDKLWGLKDAGLDIQKLWKDRKDSRDIVVAVTDSGVDCSHPELSCRAEYNAITDREGRGEAQDENGHGTHVAGTICARGNNSLGITGVSQDCQILAAKFLGAGGGGSLFDAVKALDWSVRQGAHVINASWGGPIGGEVLRKAVRRVSDAGILLVVAAGNDNRNIDTSPSYPASYKLPNVITVASHNNLGDVSNFSNYGPSTVDVVAPGSSIYSTWPGGGYKTLSGTSMAAPHVSGLLSLYLQQGDSPESAQKRLFKNTKKIWLEKSKYGRSVSVVDSVEPCPPSTTLPKCLSKKCKKCFKKCERSFECEYRKQRRCRRDCRKDNN